MMDPNYVFLLSLVIILIGYTIKRINIVDEEDGKTIAKLVLNVTLPALVFESFGNIEITAELLILPIISFGYALLVSGIVYLLTRKYDLSQRGFILMTCIGLNIGLFAYPMIRGIWGEEGMPYLIMFDLGNSFVVFVLSYGFGFAYSPDIKPDKKKFNYKYILKRIFTTIPLISLFIALFINIIGITYPPLIIDILDTLSRANMALTLLLLGILINFKFDKNQWTTILKVLIIRYGFGFFVGILLFYLLPFDKIYNVIILVALILPIGMSAIPFSVELHYNEKLASALVNFTIILSFIFMWIIVAIFGI